MVKSILSLNFFLAIFVTAVGVLYPALIAWTFLALVTLAAYAAIEIFVANAILLPAMKISLWLLQSACCLLTLALLLGLIVGLGSWLLLVILLVVAAAILPSVFIVRHSNNISVSSKF